ncbi:DNA-binding MarR family transcriptional regulator [Devosia sp. UYZn731]|uniref:MarR family winged helix-turn-helix transcriptional regulator n=1 Tax=Devosia sp. UYZn731 TaxID=3156345 RepID=UPI003397117C
MSSEDKAALIETLGRTVMRWQDATQKFDELVGHIYGLSASERLCLSFLWPGPQTASAIAREIRLTPAAVTTLVDRLEKRGYVRRKADPTDRRKVMVEAAESAHELTAQVYLPLGAAGAKMLEKYSMAELGMVDKVLSDAMAIQEQAVANLLAIHNSEQQD